MTLSVFAPRSRRRAPGFTLLELLVIGAGLSFAALYLTPAAARTRLDRQAFQCLNNHRQLALAFQLYSADNQEFLPPNPDGSSSTPGHNWCSGLAGVGEAQEFNPDVLKNPTFTPVAMYLRGNTDIFRCSADARLGRYTGSESGKIGTTVRAARSVSLNHAVGTICPGYDAGSGHSGAPKLATNGPWLDNAHSHRRDNPYRTFGKATSFTLVGPARIWLTMDEDAFSLNDGNFVMGLNTAEWIDFPGTFHDLAASVSFHDGHVELHRWLDSRTRVVNGNVARRSVPGSVDWQWLAERTSYRVP